MNEGDLDRVIALANSLDAAPHWPRSAYEAAIDPDRSPERIALAAGDDKGSIAGFAIANLVAGSAELESIAVAENCQRRGVARALFQELAGWLRERGAIELLLEVRASNSAARGFYSAMGFTAVGRRAGYYADPAEDAILFRLAIR